jgi:hypothetical protein
MKKVVCFLLVLLVARSASNAQNSIKDSTILLSMIHFDIGYQIPGGDLKNRFGSNTAAGAGFHIKNKSNLVFGIEGAFIFGNKVKNKNSIYEGIRGADGSVISQEGKLANILIFERGYQFHVDFGKIFSFKKPNPNSGILLRAGIGFMEHKIRIESRQDKIPQLEDEYLEGYDKLTNGILFHQLVAYQYYGNTRFANFYAGFEFSEALTKSRRNFDFDLMKKDDRKRTDILYGIRFGWVIPIYKSKPSDFYLY